MTYEDTFDILTIIKDLYPNSRLGSTDSGIDTLAEVWHECFAEINAELVKKAVKYFYSTDKSGFPPQTSHIVEILRRVICKPMEDSDIRYFLKRAARNGTYNSQKEFERLPEQLKKIVGNAAEIKMHAADNAAELDIWIKTIAKDYRVKAANGGLALPLGSDTPKLGVILDGQN